MVAKGSHRMRRARRRVVTIALVMGALAVSAWPGIAEEDGCVSDEASFAYNLDSATVHYSFDSADCTRPEILGFVLKAKITKEVPIQGMALQVEEEQVYCPVREACSVDTVMAHELIDYASYRGQLTYQSIESGPQTMVGIRFVQDVCGTAVETTFCHSETFPTPDE